MSAFGNFRGFERRSGSAFRGALPLVMGEVVLVKREFRVDVRVFTGEYFLDVPYPVGGGLTRGGLGWGRFRSLGIGMRVLVGFVNGSSNDPVVVQVYPGAGAQRQRGFLRGFLARFKRVDGAASDGFEDHHPSGYRVTYGPGRIEIRNGARRVLTVNVATGGVIVWGGLVVKGNVVVNGDVIGEAKGRRISLNLHGHQTPSGATTGKIPQGEI